MEHQHGARGRDRYDRIVQSLPDGLSARAVDPARDLEPIAALVNAMRANIGDPLLDSAADVRDIVAGTEVDTARDTLVVASLDGELLAYAVAYPVLDNEKPRVFLMGATHPTHRGRGLGRALLEWSIGRATEQLAALPNGTIQAQCGDSDSTAERLYKAAGMRPIRWFTDLQLRFSERPTLTDPLRFPLPEGCTSQTLEAVDRETLRSLHNACFADHWGSSPISQEFWNNEFLAHESSRPHLCEIVFDRSGTAIAYQLTSEFPQDAKTTGRVLWIDKLGVHPLHRRKGLATTLIERHLARAARDGYEGSMLGVDADSLTGANRLYARFGYTRRYGGVRYILGDAQYS